MIDLDGDGFNPRARVGRDNDGFILGRFRLSFNPRARVGRDGRRSPSARLPVQFQSTRPRGARRLGMYFHYAT